MLLNTRDFGKETDTTVSLPYSLSISTGSASSAETATIEGKYFSENISRTIKKFSGIQK